MRSKAAITDLAIRAPALDGPSRNAEQGTGTAQTRTRGLRLANEFEDHLSLGSFVSSSSSSPDRVSSFF